MDQYLAHSDPSSTHLGTGCSGKGDFIIWTHSMCFNPTDVFTEIAEGEVICLNKICPMLCDDQIFGSYFDVATSVSGHFYVTLWRDNRWWRGAQGRRKGQVFLGRFFSRIKEWFIFSVVLVWTHYSSSIVSATHPVLFFSISEGHDSEQWFSDRARDAAIGTDSVDQGPSILAWLFHTFSTTWWKFISGWQAFSIWHTGVLMGFPPPGFLSVWALRFVLATEVWRSGRVSAPGDLE